MQTVLIMQVRSASTRLPGKALLPIAGFPSSILAALRASNRGHMIRVATSTERSDDKLAETFGEYGFRVLRGSLNDVLSRFVAAVEDLPEDYLVIRLTGDNPVPDGRFLEELESYFPTSGAEYLYHSYPQSHVPYGLGAEAFTVATLRKAHAGATAMRDREHVVPWMIRNCRSAIHIPMTLDSEDLSHLRCTIDDKADYERAGDLFRGVEDPVRVGWFELARKLASMPGEPAFRVPYKVSGGRAHSEFVLGTAQLGMEYGIANRTGKPSRSIAIQMIHTAIAHGVTAIDIARAYGDAEQVAGEALAGAWGSRVEIVTKLDPLNSLARDATAKDVRAAVDESVRRSCDALGVTQLSTLLLHRWQHYREWNGAAWQRLLELRDAEEIAALGVSVYEPEEALAAMQEPAIRHIQIPMNVIDWRWKSAGVDRALSQRPEVIVHARSALLQGLLTEPAESWPISFDYDASGSLRQLREFANRYRRASVLDLCLAYVRSQPWITGVVVGCETPGQLRENLQLFRAPHLTEEQCADLEKSLPVAPQELLNPSKWKLVHEQSAR